MLYRNLSIASLASFFVLALFSGPSPAQEVSTTTATPSSDVPVCQELGLQHDTPASARREYRRANRMMLEHSSPPAKERIAKVWVRAAKLDAPCSTRQATAWTAASRLHVQSGDLDRGYQLMVMAARKAHQLGDISTAIHRYLDAAEISNEDHRFKRGQENVQRALKLLDNYKINPDQLQALQQRIDIRERKLIPSRRVAGKLSG